MERVAPVAVFYSSVALHSMSICNLSTRYKGLDRELKSRSHFINLICSGH